MGHICAFVTPSMPGLVKIGATARDPAARLAEANAPTPGRPPEPYYLACSFSVPIDETFQMKRALYAMLGDRRVNARRDFFRLAPDEARAYFALLAHQEGSPMAPGTPESY
jgi:hypothetical protein